MNSSSVMANDNLLSSKRRQLPQIPPAVGKTMDQRQMSPMPGNIFYDALPVSGLFWKNKNKYTLSSFWQLAKFENPLGVSQSGKPIQ
jgi:hypothetical protein